MYRHSDVYYFTAMMWTIAAAIIATLYDEVQTGDTKSVTNKYPIAKKWVAIRRHHVLWIDSLLQQAQELLVEKCACYTFDRSPSEILRGIFGCLASGLLTTGNEKNVSREACDPAVLSRLWILWLLRFTRPFSYTVIVIMIWKQPETSVQLHA